MLHRDPSLKRTAALLHGLLVLVAPTLALAGPLELYGAGSRGAAMAGAQTAIAHGPGAIVSNPGALAGSDVGVTIGAFATFDDARILLKDRPPGYDVPDLGDAGQALPSSETVNPRRDTDGIEPIYALTFGGVTSFGVPDLRVGMVLFLPTRQLLGGQTRFADERERLFSNKLEYELIGQRVRRLQLEAAAAYQVTKWLSFGIGGSYLPGSAVQTDVFVPDVADQENVYAVTEVDSSGDWAALAGLQIHLPYGFHVGVSHRGAVSMVVDADTQLQIRGIENDDGEKIRQDLEFTPFYSPARTSLGVAWDVGDFTLSLDGEYIFWSDYRDTQSVRPEFDDTLNGRFGTEYHYSDTTRVRFGVGFIPTPVPEQDGRTNYVDNSRLLVTFGSAHDFVVAGVPFEVAWFLEFQGLVERETVKAQLDEYPHCEPGVTELCDEVPDDLEDPETGRPFPEARGLQTGNPGFPGWVSGGWIGAVGLEVTL